MARVVIAEDDPDLLESYSRILARAGHDVVQCPDGSAGLTCVREHRPDLLLADVVMPGMTGLELASAVKADPELAEIPIILVTGGWAEMDAAELPKVARLLRKPVAPQDLVGQVESVLADGRRYHVWLPSQRTQPADDSTAVTGQER
ncbi:response regulator [Planosporangium flavigriseum]|uniref:Transcriptional regulator n=1 Tax=Planosporangium flavigriseum TaxID=373681 RepID=A0A8J3LKC8_9ACTN|nr:response regulator [Planosporangium flavigriseum]NJC63556.1 response regulator [Planosporangium flavigriseum]GIG72253.1 transcriptional regulator [Planosporangium flavigriseum]